MVEVLLIAGDQVPVMLLSDIVGNGAITPPEHIAATGLKVGVIAGLTVMLNVVVEAHCPAVGVKV